LLGSGVAHMLIRMMMTSCCKSLGARIACMLCVILFTQTPLLAQDAPPQPDLNQFPPPWLSLLIMLVLFAVLMGVSLMPSKRGHQD
jgi:hypothetical protein